MPSIVETIELLETFTKLPKGWNFGEGEPSAPLPLEQSKAILYFAHTLGLADIDAFPGTDGEIQLNIYKEDANIELMLEINGTIGVTFEEGDKYVRLARAVSLNEIFKYLKEFQYNKCRTSVSLTSQSTTFPEKSALQAPRSSPRVMESVYQLSIKNVGKNTAAQYAPTLQNIMRASREPQLSFGRSRTNKSPKPVHLSRA